MAHFDEFWIVETFLEGTAFGGARMAARSGALILTREVRMKSEDGTGQVST
jgi:hypothetical protein